ncbi:phage tail sheath subtilisin-like domain-containing protein [Streptomyces sp. RTd22]|uniref:phage tail sheath subtilisin-like domain-containing protein n=1 Tax=Streptomyces sp. RTd22 TaxID=1841249 RepID=UPI0007C44B66|nr:phage tail sheath subtilisin-like domain-containing protein [Streptomyces sp. RTd22]
MATFLRPGIYVDETLDAISNPVTANPGEAIAAFVGAHNFGPAVPTLITSWSQFNLVYGGWGTGTDLLPYAVYSYFSNGGGKAYICRAVPADSVAAAVTLNDRQATPEPLLTLTARAAGAFGNKVYIDVTDANTGAGRFNLAVKVGGTTDTYIADRYNDVSLDPADSRNLVAMINSPVNGSAFVKADYIATDAWSTPITPAVQTGTPLTGGIDGSATPDLVAATKQLESTGEIVNINLPGVTDTSILNAVITWAEDYGYAFVVVDAPQTPSLDVPSAVTAYAKLSPAANSSTSPPPLKASSYAAVYGPWLVSADPSSIAAGATRTLPPGGAVLGRFAQTDTLYGPHQSAAGTLSRLVGVYSTELRFTNSQLDNLNAWGINIIRQIPQAGICIMGARTLKSGYPDRYVAVRRLLTYTRKILVDLTRSAVFAPNTPELWHSISATLSQQLTTQAQAGMFASSTPDTAFQVICDDTNNTATTVDNGEVHIDVGIAVARPAEYVAIHISQYDGGATVTESS